MESKIFRKVSLERLSSPEQLDQILRVTDAKTWAALLGILLLLAVSVTWGYTGIITTKASGQGLIVRTGGVLNIATAGAGTVVDIKANVGDHIKPNQVIARVAQPELAETIRAMQEVTQQNIASNVVAPYGGQVLEVKVYPGASVQAGTPLLSIQTDVQNLEVLAYLPSDKAKNVEVGMEAQISPSTVKREEHGFVRGKVSYVSDYPSTPAALMRNFQNESIVQLLTREGPVMEVRVSLLADPKTVSGFAWSSPGGRSVTISSGTICTAQIVTRKQKPISLVFPYVKEKLGIS